MGQRNSEETLRNSIDAAPTVDFDQLEDVPQVRELKRELSQTKARLYEVEGKFIKIKVSLCSKFKSFYFHQAKYRA